MQTGWQVSKRIKGEVRSSLLTPSINTTYIQRHVSYMFFNIYIWFHLWRFYRIPVIIWISPTTNVTKLGGTFSLIRTATEMFGLSASLLENIIRNMYLVHGNVMPKVQNNSLKHDSKLPEDITHAECRLGHFKGYSTRTATAKTFIPYIGILFLTWQDSQLTNTHHKPLL